MTKQTTIVVIGSLRVNIISNMLCTNTSLYSKLTFTILWDNLADDILKYCFFLVFPRKKRLWRENLHEMLRRQFGEMSSVFSGRLALVLSFFGFFFLLLFFFLVLVMCLGASLIHILVASLILKAVFYMHRRR